MFLGGILRRFWVWSPAILLDPYDLWDKLVKPMLPGSGFSLPWSPDWAPLVLIGLIFWAAFLTFHELRTRADHGDEIPTLWLPFWEFSSLRDNPVLFRRLIPFKRAAEIAYKKTERKLVAKFAEAEGRRGGKSDRNAMLEFYARYLLGSSQAEINLFGYRPPATRLEQIDPRYFPSCALIDGGNTLIQYSDPDVKWHPVWIMAKDLKRRLKEIRKD